MRGGGCGPPAFSFEAIVFDLPAGVPAGTVLVASAVARAAIDGGPAGVRLADLEGEIHRAMRQPVYRPVLAA